MAITRTAMVDDDGSGTTGTVLNNAWKQELYNQIDAADVSTVGGLWTRWTPTTRSTNGTWTPGSIDCRWLKIQQLYVLTCVFGLPSPGTLSLDSATLFFTYPPGFSLGGVYQIEAPCRIVQGNNVPFSGFLQPATGTEIGIFRLDSANIVAGAALRVTAQVICLYPGT